MNALERVLAGEGKLAILGLGYLGYSNLASYLKTGLRCVATDPSRTRREAFAAGTYPPANRYRFWQGWAETLDVLPDGRFELKDLDGTFSDEAVSVFLVCLPYNYAASADNAALVDVVERVAAAAASRGDCVVVFEQTLPVHALDGRFLPVLKRAGATPERGVSVVYAPRPDWNMEELAAARVPRLFAVRGSAEGGEVADLLARASGTVSDGGSIAEVELAHILRWAGMHVMNSLVAQMVFAYPNTNVAGVLALLKDDPSFPDALPVNGGFEPPLGATLLLDGASSPNYLTILNESMSAYFSMQHLLVEKVKAAGCRSAAVLGLLPHEHKPEQEASPVVELPRMLAHEGVDVVVHDPTLSEARIRHNTATRPMGFPECLDGREAVILLSDHPVYSMPLASDLRERLSQCKLVIDGLGVWRRHGFGTDESFRYTVVGQGQSL